MTPGQIRTPGGELELNAGKRARSIIVTNTGDRPIQVGSHLHLPDANPALELDRAAARGHHLDIPAGGSIRFLPGDAKEVAIVPFGGTGRVPGIQRDKTEAEIATGAPAKEGKETR
ncbi:urease subunit beta [Nocardiopsis rhodophaea]|uniref:Urease subunit beta n=1 Tax=Nocardiopsis rhodophaea TaxID=280238 RepID=A0ABN2T931_9ACTN